MPARRRTPAHHLARQTVELAIAAPQVVAHRVVRLARAGRRPSAADRQEFALMGSEKLQAFWQSWLAMTGQAVVAQWQLAQAWWSVPFGLATGSPWAAPRALGRSLQAAASVWSAGLTPVHAKAVANARRLARRR